MTATRFDHTQLMHGHDYAGENCEGWLFQRKWDGWFAGWDGERLFTKEGNTIAAPDFFTAGLPDFPLCCELVAGKEGANHTQSLIRTKTNPREWEHARLYVFDAPLTRVPKYWGDNNVEMRLKAGEGDWLGAKHAQVVRTFPLHDRAQLRDELRAVLDAGGEGLMIQPPHNPYVAGRTRRLLKVKRGSLHVFRTL